jgi:hypothetical protein
MVITTSTIGDARQPEHDWSGVPNLGRPLPFRPLPVLSGTAARLEGSTYAGWDCSCDPGRVGLGVRHVVRAGVAMIESPPPRARADGSIPERPPAVVCPTARLVERCAPAPFARVSSTAAAPAAQSAAAPAARPVPQALAAGDLPKGCTARSLLPHAAGPAALVRARLMPGGPEVAVVALVGPSGRWSAFWSGPGLDGPLAFAEAWCRADGEPDSPMVPVGLGDLRKIVIKGAAFDGLSVAVDG